jgi:L-aspartate oxidase
LEVLVFGKRIIERTRDKVNTTGIAEKNTVIMPERNTNNGKFPGLSSMSLESLLWENVGIVRSGDKMREAVRILAAWGKELERPTDRPSYELSNMVLVGRLMTEAALIREESRGAHFRSDFTESSGEWLRHVVFRKND